MARKKQGIKKQLEEENDFLKMKMMLERGAQFYSEGEAQLPPEVENQFLMHILEFQRQFDHKKLVKLYEKIGSPTHFLPVDKIAEEDFPKAWENLSLHLNQHGITLEACSPRVTKKELYRFTIEELFNQEVTDMNIPGMMHGFIYDEFYPDHEYDNERMVEFCVWRILQKKPIDFLELFKDNLTLNEHCNLTQEQFIALVNNFKNAYEEIDEPEISNLECNIEGEKCEVRGIYAITVRIPKESIVLTGNWKVRLKLNDNRGLWRIEHMEFEGIKF